MITNTLPTPLVNIVNILEIYKTPNLHIPLHLNLLIPKFPRLQFSKFLTFHINMRTRDIDTKSHKHFLSRYK